MDGRLLSDTRKRSKGTKRKMKVDAMSSKSKNLLNADKTHQHAVALAQRMARCNRFLSQLSALQEG